MKRAPAVALALLASFCACGRLDLGGYGSPRADGAEDETPGASAGGGASVATAGKNSQGGSPRVEPPPAEAAGMPSTDPQESAAGAGGMSPGGSGGEGAGGAVGEPSGGAGGSDDGPMLMRSCRYLPEICGMDMRSCCAVGYVPGGEFVASTRLGEAWPAPTGKSHVSGFALGRFEVTVGRFRAFLDDYEDWRASGAPRPGDGSHPLIPGSGWDPGWLRHETDPPDRYGLGVDRQEVESQVADCFGAPLSTAMWGQPVNCVTFYEAQAFCIWDGGRLPTDLEWEYAAAGGEENRLYPWGSYEPTHGLASYGCIAELPYSPCPVPSVGSYPSGIGRFGQLDLAGSLQEWTFDAVGVPRDLPCSDCASVEWIHASNPRTSRGGSWNGDAEELKVTTTDMLEARVRLSSYGFRCAYDLPAPSSPSP